MKAFFGILLLPQAMQLWDVLSLEQMSHHELNRFAAQD